MKLLLICARVLPEKSNNANLAWKLIPHLRQTHELQVLSICSAAPSNGTLCTELDGVKVWFAPAFQISRAKRLRNRAVSALADRGGLGDAAQALEAAECLRQIRKSFPYDAVLTTVEPYAGALTLLRVPRRIPCAVYLMDPTIYDRPFAPRVRYRARSLGAILSRARAVATTPFIRAALAEHGYGQYDGRVVPVGFPMIGAQSATRRREDDGRVHLLFCGWLYSDIRSPKYFLELLSRLDGRFSVTFMGRECEKLTERFDVPPKAELITLPQQPYETALRAMADADILINIGNSVPVHMPSKTLEYINTGKPFVNFHKLDDCPTLYYTKRYPLCLNLSERDPDLDAAAARFTEFCLQNKGKTVDRAAIEAEYADCTPAYIAQKILDAIGA
ncbi:MAG: hypothetical protein IKO68_08500 [Oscillospiraceae bacterium]|nr:hypothetical protein [Oscillospiraceae bacterium]